MLREEIFCDFALTIPFVNQAKRQRQIRAGINRNVQVNFTGGKIILRVDDGDKGAIALGFAQEGHEMDIRSLGIAAPNDDALGLRVVFESDAGHFAIDRESRFGGGSRAQRAGQARGARNRSRARASRREW